ncbi:phosphotransferase [Cellulosimicrobium sp. NPDC057862]|uniref:serine/threonine protein kinase n=1 Tax=Cellulosimicrobium sp. NPDC057862 TaxID=3346266 RepID=UPI00366AF573
MPMSDADLRRFAILDEPMTGKGKRGLLIEQVRKSDFTIEYVLDPHPYESSVSLRAGDTFGLFLKPGATARRLFGLDREVLLWCSTFGQFQARDIEAISKTIEQHGARLSRHFAILVTRYDPKSRNALEAESGSQHTLVHISLDDLVRQPLQALLAKHLYARDVFDVAGAAVRSADFFGRRELVDMLAGEVENGWSQIGLFGLRKVGKTSLLNRLADKLQNSSKVSVARLDLQWSTAISLAPEYTLWSLGSSIYASHKAIRALGGFRMLGRHATFSELADPSSVWEDFAHDMRLLATKSKRRVCILIDEIERLYERPKETQFTRVFRILRGLDQQHPGRFRIVLGGTSPECVENGFVLDEDNPLFNYVKVEYVGPLSDADSADLLRVLGRQVGLSFHEDAIGLAIEECGGHPALLRALGSTIHRTSPARETLADVSRTQISSVLPQFSQRATPLLDQMLAALEAQHPDEHLILNSLAHGRVFEFREYAEISTNEVARLRAYGLLAQHGESLAMRQLHSRMIAQKSEVERSRGQVMYGPGDGLGKWSVAECIASGGSGDVYRATSAGSEVAIKVFRGANLEMLQREVDVLREIEHTNIVRFLDAIRTENGHPALVTEYLGGVDASRYCSPSSRPSFADWRSWLALMLDALDSMHPRVSEVRVLEARDELTSEELVRWDRARHGYVHRDIKPENVIIVPNRGPVLVDFNIASRAGAPVLTVSGTNGYQAPAGVRWEPAVDLYALGVMFLELATGIRVHSASIDELRIGAETCVGSAGLTVVDMLLDSPESECTARQVRDRVLKLNVR